MKRKILLFFSILILGFVLLGCDLLGNTSTTLSSSTTDSSTTSSTTAVSETSSSTADFRLDIIETEWDVILALLPMEISSDFNLPQSTNPLVDIEYRLNDVVLESGVLSYEKKPYDLLLELQIIFSYDDYTLTKTHEITQVLDEETYQNTQIDLIFDEAFNQISAKIPNVMASDLTLPKINILNVSVEYETEELKIFHNRLLLDFNDISKTVFITVRVSYKQETREMIIPVIVSSYHDLPRIPEIRINTDYNAEITSKEVYTNGNLSLTVFGINQTPIIELEEAEMKIRLRGNSTLYMPKKSYKIKFAEKTTMLSDYEEKDWVLLANFSDQTLIRNYLAFNMARKLDFDFTPAAKFVDLFINDVFQGNYLLSDQIEVTNDRVDIEEKSEDIDTGYLLEYDRGLFNVGLEESGENYFLIEDVPFVIKSPDWEDSHYSTNQKQFIVDYMNLVYDTITSQEDYSHLIDEASFIDWFIVNEVFKNVDSGYSSVYFYKDKGEILKMGPVWDFDLSSGNPGHLDESLRGPTGWYTSRVDKNLFFFYLMEYDSFRQSLKARWNEVYDDVIYSLLGEIYEASDSITYSRYLNFELWDVIGKNDEWYTAPEILALETYEEQVWFLYDYLENRIFWLNQKINYF